MIRHTLLSLFVLFACTCLVAGCGNNSPKFDETQVEEQTAEEIAEAEDYEKMMQKQYEETTQGADASQ